MWSSRRPGVATMTSTPLRKACSCGRMPRPPKTDAVVVRVWRASSRTCCSICAASSRVGVRTSARVVPLGLSVRRCRIGRAKAAVLPLPVIAVATRSRPSMAAGIVCSWIGVGFTKPRSETPRSSVVWSWKAEKGNEPRSLSYRRVCLLKNGGIRRDAAVRRGSLAEREGLKCLTLRLGSRMARPARQSSMC